MWEVDSDAEVGAFEAHGIIWPSSSALKELVAHIDDSADVGEASTQYADPIHRAPTIRGLSMQSIVATSCFCSLLILVVLTGLGRLVVGYKSCSATTDHVVTSALEKGVEQRHDHEQEHTAALDNARFVMVILIVNDHLRWNYDRPGESTWLHGDFWGGVALDPLLPIAGFAILSGYLSRGAPSPHRWRNLFALILTCLAFSIVIFPVLELLVRLRVPTSAEWLSRIINAEPRFDWYIQSLVLWRLLAYGTHKIGSATKTSSWPWIVVCCFIIHATNPYLRLEVWSYNCAAVFLPAFTVGLLFPLERLLEAVPRTSVVTFLGLLALVGWAVLVGGGTCLGPSWRLTGFGKLYETLPDKNVRIYAQRTRGTWEIGFLWVQCLFKVLLQVVVFLTFFVCVCPRCRNWFTYAGQNGGLYAYLLHSQLFCRPYLFVTDALPLPLVEHPMGHLCVRILQLFLCAGAVFVLASKPCVWLFSQVLQPGWLVDWFLHALPKRYAGVTHDESQVEQSMEFVRA